MTSRQRISSAVLSPYPVLISTAVTPTSWPTFVRTRSACTVTPAARFFLRIRLETLFVLENQDQGKLKLLPTNLRALNRQACQLDGRCESAGEVSVGYRSFSIIR